MDANTFCQSYINLTHQALPVYQKSAAIEYEYKRLKQDSEHYVHYLTKFELFFDKYPSLQKELFVYLSELKIGAFIEYKLDLFYAELEKAERLKTEIQQEIAVLRNNFVGETKNWLPEEEAKIESYCRFFDTASVQQVTDFLNIHLKKLKGEREKLGGGTKQEATINTLIEGETERQRKQREAREKLKEKKRRK
jgi:hypothetical protein